MHQPDLFSTNTQRERGLNRGVNAGNEGVARGGLRESPCEVPMRNRAGPMTTCDQEAGIPPSRGHGVRDTSRAAYAEQKASGNLNNNQQRIVDLLRANPGRDYTRSEIGRALNLPANVFSGRVNELIHVKRILVEKRRRVCGVTGKTVYAVGLRG